MTNRIAFFREMYGDDGSIPSHFGRYPSYDEDEEDEDEDAEEAAVGEASVDKAQAGDAAAPAQTEEQPLVLVIRRIASVDAAGQGHFVVFSAVGYVFEMARSLFWLTVS